MAWGKAKSYFAVVIILVTAVVFRFTYLDRIPSAISGDELIYVITAKSMYLTGHDLTGTWNPVSALLFSHPPNQTQAELPYFLHYLFTSAFPFSILLAKMPFAVLSVGIVLLLYAIASELFGTPVALATGLLAAVNPWLVVMGRTGYESTPATFFYLLGLLLLIRLRSWKILLSFVPFALAFYSYIATKLIFIPFILLSTYLGLHIHKGQYKKQYIWIIGLSIAFVTLYLYLLKTNYSYRVADLVTPGSSIVIDQVNELRKSSVQSAFTPMLVNRYAVYIQLLVSKFFRVFSPEYLFVDGDQFFLPLHQSFFYYLDALFIIIGATTLIFRKRIYAIIIFLFIITGALPHVFHRTITDFSGHLAIMFPFFIVLTGAGIATTLMSVARRFYTIAIITILFLYAGNIGGFVNAYYYRYPIIGSQDFPMRVLARYISLTRQLPPSIEVYSARKGDFFQKYMFYTNTLTKISVGTVGAIDTRAPFTFNGVRFTDCDTHVHEVEPNHIAIYDATCAMNIPGNKLRIARLMDGGTAYTIVNDSLCANTQLNSYPGGITFDNLNVEHLSPAQFCQTYISR